MSGRIKNKTSKAIAFSDVGFYILAVIYFLLGPVNLLIFLRYIDFNSYGSISAASAAQAFFTAGVCFFGVAPVIIAIILSIIALIKSKSSALSGVKARRIRWRSGAILLALPVAFFVIELLSLLKTTTVSLLIEWMVISIVLMLFVIIPIVKTR